MTGEPFLIRVEADAPGERALEPLTCGIPFSRGLVRDPAAIALRGPEGDDLPVQARALDRWSDGSLRWALVDWRASFAGSARFEVRIADRGAKLPILAQPLRVSEGPEAGRVVIDTGCARFELGGRSLIRSIDGDGEARGELRVDGDLARISEIAIEEAGPIRATARISGTVGSPPKDAGRRAEPLLRFTARLHFFAGSAVVRHVVTLLNPRRAVHPGGLWDLGDPGSVLFQEATLRFALEGGSGAAATTFSPDKGSPFERVDGAPSLEIYQDSSGGESWQSENHVNRDRVVPLSFRGYRLRAGAGERAGLRATPALVLERGGRTLGFAMERFWQNFPKAVEVEDGALAIGLFPRQHADCHEMQGGEQKTHDLFVSFGRDGVTAEPLAWCRSRARACPDPIWTSTTGAVRWLVPGDKVDALHLELMGSAIEGEGSFERKREIQDEYGWRHFGDIVADHEAAGDPLVSHYNNQYDAIAGFARRLLATGDFRWQAPMLDLAAHVMDIDVYRTDRDRSAYNGGLFWHTFHYVDAGTSTHRSYPSGQAVPGGGPSAEHLYTTGLMLVHFLTGDPLARETVIGLARFAIAIDDGRRTPFRFLAGGPTGLASATGSPDYHGPGRAPGNAISALVDAHRLTGDRALLEKAEELLRRCIHPDDDIEARNLLDAERRWYYTVFLEAVGKLLDHLAERGELGRTYAYGRAALLAYARFMAEREYPYLEKPEILEYPTETWAAQDMRKSDVLELAALHAEGEERARFLERAELFFRTSTSTLAGMKTRTLARPVVLLLGRGFLHAYIRAHPDVRAPLPEGGPWDLGRPEVFVPQKARAKRNLALIAVLAAAALAGAAALLFVHGMLPA